MVQVGWFRPLVTKLLPSTMKRVRNIMRTVVLIDDRALGIIPHAAGPHEVSGGCSIFDRQRPFIAGACGVEQFQRSVTEKVQRLEVIRMALVRDAQCW